MKNEQGFTLIELLVVIGITIILFLIIFVNLKPVDNLEHATTEFVSRARLAQNMSQTGQKCCTANKVPKNYSVAFGLNSDQYIFQALTGAMGNEIIQEYKLPVGLIFKDCVDDLGVIYDPCQITWQVPDGHVYVGAQGINLFLDVLITDLGLVETKKVRINAVSGVISEI